MAVGLLRPDAGIVRVFGVDVRARAAHRRRVARPHRLRSLPASTVAERAGELLDVVELRDADHKLVMDYSEGIQKEIGLAASLLHAAKLLVLDEPFEAVDPVSAATIRTILLRFGGAGRAAVCVHRSDHPGTGDPHLVLVAGTQPMRSGRGD